MNPHAVFDWGQVDWSATAQAVWPILAMLCVSMVVIMAMVISAFGGWGDVRDAGSEAIERQVNRARRWDGKAPLPLRWEREAEEYQRQVTDTIRVLAELRKMRMTGLAAVQPEDRP